MDVDLLANMEAADLGFFNLRLHPELAGINDGHDLVALDQGIAGDSEPLDHHPVHWRGEGRMLAPLGAIVLEGEAVQLA